MMKQPEKPGNKTHFDGRSMKKIMIAMPLFFFLTCLGRQSFLWSEETPPATPSADQEMIFQSTEIAAETQVDTQASEEDLKKDIASGLEQMFLHSNFENLIAYSSGGEELEEIGALASSLILKNLQPTENGYQAEWKLVFQFWEGTEVSSRKPFEVTEAQAADILNEEMLQSFLAEFIDSIAVKAREVQLDGAESTSDQLIQYLQSLRPQITERSSLMLSQMIASIPEEKIKLEKQLEARFGILKEEPLAPLEPLEPETLEPETGSQDIPTASEPEAIPTAPALDSDETVSLQEEPNGGELTEPSADALTAEAYEEEEKETPKIEKEKGLTPPASPGSLTLSEEDPEPPHLPETQSKQEERPDPWDSIEKKVEKAEGANKKKSSASQNPYKRLLAEYFQLTQERDKQRMNYEAYTSLSKKMGKLKSQLQTLGYYRLSAQERSPIEKGVKKEMGIQTQS